MDQKRTKDGQKQVLFRYRRIIYRWKAYGEVITTFVKKNENCHFGPKMAQNGPKEDQKWVFFKYSRIIYRWKAYGEVITTFLKLFEIFHFQAQNGPK